MLLSVILVSCNSSTPTPTAAPNGPPVTQVSVSGQGTFADGTPVASDNVQYQLILDGANLFQVGPGGCTQTPAHVAGTIIENATTSANGQITWSVPVTSLRAAVVRACQIQQLGSSQIEGIRIKASLLADQNTCPVFCAAQGDPSANCVNNCSAGNRTIGGTYATTPEMLAALLAQEKNGVLAIQGGILFSELGPALSLGAGPDLQVDAGAAQSSAHITQESFAAGACEIAESCVRATGLRKLLRFDGTIQNLGSSDLVIGSPDNNPLFTLSSCHHVELLQNIMVYELIDPATNQVVSVDNQQIIGRKQGFYMMDISQVNASAPQGQYDCTNQGITAGWADIYDSSLECQYLDITGVPSGNYNLRLTVNPDGLFSESDLSNNIVNLPVNIP